MLISFEKKLLLIISILILSTSFSLAQGISFLNDYLGNVLIFDKGEIKQLESHPIKSHKIANKMMAYEDNAGNMKIYFNRYTFKINSFANDYLVSNNLAVVRMNRQIKVFDNGDIKDLSMNVSSYYLGEDIVVWFDDFDKMLRAYYDKSIYDLDDGLTGDVSTSSKTKDYTDVKIGKNIASFSSSQGISNIFYRGEIFELGQKDRIKKLSVGKDILAFIEEPLCNLQAYYYGEIIEIEDFEPKSFAAGDSFLGYLDANNYLKVFSNNRTQILSHEAPNWYIVKDNIIAFSVQNFFKVWYNGKIFTLESRFIPDDIIINNNFVAYKDRFGNLNLFNGQEVKTISYEKIKQFDVYGNLVKYTYGIKSEQIFYNQKTYNNN